MAVDASLAGRTFPPTEPYDVTEQAVADFAAATGTPYASGDPAPATFPIVVAFGAMQELMRDPEVGIELHHVVHGQQRFVHESPVRAGDSLRAELSVTGLRQIGGADIITTSSAIIDADGRLVCTAEATLVHRAGGA
jgi:acyl dehydratase